MDDAQALLPAGKLVVICNGAGYLTSEAVANVDRLFDGPVGPMNLQKVMDPVPTSQKMHAVINLIC